VIRDNAGEAGREVGSTKACHTHYIAKDFRPPQGVAEVLPSLTAHLKLETEL